MRRRTLLSLLSLFVVIAFAIVHLVAQAAPQAKPPAGAQVPAATPAAKAAPRQMAPMMASVDPALFKGLHYRLVGPSRGGRVTTVTGVPSQPKTFYMGVASGGVFRTTDGGLNWVPITDGKVPLGSTGSIAVADSDPNVIYLGTGSDGVRSNVSTGRGVYKTTDGGATWTFAGLYNAGQIGAVRIHPTNPDIVWVSAVGDAFKPNTERGVFKTTDGGKTWKKVLFVSDQVGAMDVELHPTNPNIVYAWMSHLERKPWTIISGSRVGGFYKSTDGGESFTRIMTGLPNELIGKGNLAVTAAKPDRIFALVEAKPGGGFYRSDDAGQTWALVNSQGALIQRPFYYTTLGADPTNADVVYAGAESIFKSADGGKTFANFRAPHGDHHDIWVSPKDGKLLIESNDGGANVSTDGGLTWTTQNNQPTAEIYGVWMDNQFPYKLYGAQQDSTTVIISSQAEPYTLTDWRTGPGCETGPIMPHPLNPDYVYGSCKGQFTWMDLKTGQEKNYWVGGQSLYGNPASDLIYRMQRVSPMATSPHDPNVVYYGSQYLHRSRDKGVTWERISPDLTAKPAGTQGVSGEPITRDVTGEEFYSTLYAITESTLEPNVIWVGSNDGPYHVTRDNGKTWTNITPKDLPPGGRVAWIDASPHRPGSAYYATYRYLLGDYQPYIFRTDDYGATWKRLTDGKNGIPADTPTRVVREDPDREGLLYAGTEFGMYISFDNGGHWQPFQLNLPQVPINDVRVYHKDLVIATQGRAFWILDNLTSLHQITPKTTTSEVRLLKPRDGYRTTVAPAILGPTIEYYLPTAGTPVKIEILDAKGAVVNSYDSERQPAAGVGGRGGRGGGVGAAAGAGAGAAAGAGAGAEAFDPESQGMGRGRGGFTPRVTKDAGLNRFVWDVRDTTPEALDARGGVAGGVVGGVPGGVPGGAAGGGRGGGGQGLAMPPGQYQARLIAGSTQTQTFRVLIDPRLAAEGVTVADLQEQYAHNLRMRALVTSVGEVVTRVRNAQTNLKGATGADAEKAKAIDAIAEKLLTDNTVRYNKPGLQSHITYLAGMTSRVDQKIGRDAIERYAVVKKELDAIRGEVDRVLGSTTK